MSICVTVTCGMCCPVSCICIVKPCSWQGNSTVGSLLFRNCNFLVSCLLNCQTTVHKYG